jgi:glycosyltransferase involved in cell wall biosynthesis
MTIDEHAAMPLVSVIVRSFNRAPSLCELVETLLRQTWTNLEIVIVEQSTEVPDAAAARLATLARDPRVRVLKRRPLGGAAARNVGVENARGDVFLFIDDDDLPTDEHWVAMHMHVLEDPKCLGVSGKHVHNDELRHRFSPLFEAFTRTLSYDPVLKISMTYVQHDRRRMPVYALHGSNASLRRTAWQRFGGWDEDTAIEDEVSFCFRALRMKRADEYFAYDPRPVMLRNRDVVGGLNKRRMSVTAFFGHYIDFVHRIIGRYYPLRVMLMYPIYVLLTYFMTVGTIWRHSRKYRGVLPNVAAALQLLVELPFHLASAWIRLFAPPGVTGKVGAARLQPVPTKAIADETSP